MKQYRENPDGDKNQRETLDNERAVFAAKMTFLRDNAKPNQKPAMDVAHPTKEDMGKADAAEDTL